MKKKIGASLPEHITEKMEMYAKALDTTPTEYLGLIAKEWFARGCPPVTPEEKALREQEPNATARRAS